MKLQGKVALVTGASSGIGAATALALAGEGAKVAIGARRTDRLAEVEQQIRDSGGEVFSAELDVTDPAQIARFVAAAEQALGPVDILVNNAGLARGTGTMADGDPDGGWREMIETNVLGLMHMTSAVLPGMIARGGGHIVNMGSIAGHQGYERGGGYCASKFAVRGVTQTLRQELYSKNVRVSTVDPGMVETEFSLVRFDGDEAKASALYADMDPLIGADIAECIRWVVTLPPHVNIDEIVVKPTAQAAVGKVARAGRN